MVCSQLHEVGQPEYVYQVETGDLLAQHAERDLFPPFEPPAQDLHNPHPQHPTQQARQKGEHYPQDTPQFAQ